MSRNIVDTFTELDVNPLTLIPLLKFKIDNSSDDCRIFYTAPSTLDGESNCNNNISLNKASDFLYLYNITNKSMVTKSSIYYDYDFYVPSGCGGCEFAIMAFPHTIYKFFKLNFENNPRIVNVWDTYVYNLINYKGMFKNCYNIGLYEGSIFPSSILDSAGTYVYKRNKVFMYDYIFANNFKVVTLPDSYPELLPGERFSDFNDTNKLSLNYAFMNTEKATSAPIITSLYYGTVHELGGNGIFFNSNMPYYDDNLKFDNVYELRNTFAKTTNTESSKYLSITINKCKSMEAMLKDSTKYKTVYIYLENTMSNMNNAFKNLSNGTTIEYNSNNEMSLSMDELIGLYSGCKQLVSLSPNMKFSNARIICNVFKDCELLSNNKFNTINTENAVIFSGVYNGCLGLTSFNISSTNNGNNFSSVCILNEAWKNCSNITGFNGWFNLGTSERNIYADSTFAGCSKLTTIPAISNEKLITSSVEMFKGTQIANTNYSYTVNSENRTGSYSNMINNKNVSGMFLECSKLTNSINTPAAVFASNMYAECKALASASFNFSNARYLVALFKNCIGLNNIINNGNLNKVKDASSLFEGCSALTSGTEKINTSNCKTLVALYKGCRNLTSATININNAENVDNMLYGCSNLSNLTLNWGSSTPRISVRGTALNSTAINNIINNLPDVSQYIVNNPSDMLTNLTWTECTGSNSFNLCKTLYYKTFKSSNIQLAPGEYNLSIPGWCDVKTDGSGEYSYFTDVGACVVNASTNEIVSSMMYSNGYGVNSQVNISKSDNYYVVINANINERPTVTLTWNVVYHKLDIRDTPGSSNISSINISAANNKGWQIIHKDTQIIKRSVKRAISTINEYEVDSIIDLTKINNNNIDEDNFTTEVFSIDSGYYTLFSKSNNNDNFKVYKVLEDGEYPIAISYDKDYVLCFNVDNRCNIRIKYRNENKDLILQKS